VDVSEVRMPAGSSERIAEDALAGALIRLCRGGTWQALARELAWRAVTGGNRDPRSVEALSEAAEAMLGSLVDQALWEVERSVLVSFDEFAREHPGDAAGALVAARLDAGEEAERLVAAAYDEVVETLLARTRRAA
jgi:hypothetical protein